LKNPTRGYFDPRDIYTALPQGLIANRPYASFATAAGTRTKAGRPLAGMRIGIVREYMVKHAANDAAMSDQVDAEIKKVLRDRLGGELVESFDPMYPDDPSIPNLTYNDVLNAAKNSYIGAVNNDRRSALEFPLPVGISFWAGPGEEGVVISVAAAYEAATKHRAAPPAFGALSHTQGER
jgi:Asp-tRNA(Asn)/Glu-tRNA(Gln) amidotransferase A subunit family amidase